MKIAFLVQGLFEKSDSIGLDCVYQYRMCKDYFLSADVKIYSEKFDVIRYKDISICQVSDLLFQLNDPDLLVIYHYCDSWPEIESRLIYSAAKLILRWHNNTPPWFLAAYSRHGLHRTLKGFSTIKKLGQTRRFLFMCNSSFTAKQLSMLGIDHGILPYVYPASRYLDEAQLSNVSLSHSIDNYDNRRRSDNGLHLLFVGRIAPHKGHRHVMAIAQQLQKLSNRKVVVDFPGRADQSALPYIDDLHTLSRNLDVEMRLLGEVDDDDLKALYLNSHAFICMSEHEGFGLPVYEAMVKGLPTATWANTAFAEMLTGHPLTFDELVYDRIAFALHRLQDPSYRSSVIEYQFNNVIPKYNRQTVVAQLINSVSTAQRFIVSRHGDIDIQIPKEIHDNFVCDHDLIAYDSLIAEDKVSGLHGEWMSQFIPCTGFLSQSGEVKSAPFLIDKFSNDKHIIFGPYMDLPAGNYRVTFDIHFDQTITDIPPLAELIRFHIDVFSGETFAERQICASPSHSEASRSLEFNFNAPVSAVEFRIRALDENPQGAQIMSFFGVILSKIFRRGADASLYASSKRINSYALVHASGFATVFDLTSTLQIKSDSDFVRVCYEKLFGRIPDQEGELHYLGMLSRGHITRTEFISNLIKSEEGSSRNIMLA